MFLIFKRKKPGVVQSLFSDYKGPLKDGPIGKKMREDTQRRAKMWLRSATTEDIIKELRRRRVFV
jgi:hypothetical protein